MRGGKREGAGAPPHEPTKASRDAVRLYAAMGTPQEDIGRLLKIDVKTLYKYYREELDLGLVAANAQIGGALFKKAMGGDTTAMILFSNKVVSTTSLLRCIFENFTQCIGD
jgi:hypothetical protein